MRWSGGSVNWDRYGSCYPEVGRVPDLQALTYLRDSLSHRAGLLRHEPECFAIPSQPSPNQQAAGATIRSCTCRITGTEILIRSLAEVHRQGMSRLFLNRRHSVCACVMLNAMCNACNISKIV